MFTNFEDFTYSSVNNFPKETCTIPDRHEPSIFYSDKKYQVLYIDPRFSMEKHITYATPYIWMDNGKPTFGWTPTDGSLILGNVENSCQYYDYFVIGFISVDDAYIAQDKEAFAEYDQIIKTYQKKWQEND